MKSTTDTTTTAREIDWDEYLRTYTLPPATEAETETETAEAKTAQVNLAFETARYTFGVAGTHFLMAFKALGAALNLAVYALIQVCRR